MSTTSRFSIGRDSLVRYIFDEGFFDRVPELADLKDLFASCRNTYQQELAKKGCSCRMTTAWAKDCITQMMDKIDAAKKENHALVRNFIRIVGHYASDADVDHVGVTVMHDKTYDIFVDTTPATEAEQNDRV
jgi:hypothetical protein